MATMTLNPRNASNRGGMAVDNSLGMREPFVWLRQGIADFKRIPGLSLLYGMLFTGLCVGIFYLTRNVPWYTVAYITGLAFAGPFLASGLYAASRDMGRGVRPSIMGSFRLIEKRKTYLGLFALMLTLVMAAWVRLSALVLAVTYNGLAPNADVLNLSWVGSELVVTIAYLAVIGFVLAGTMFAVSAFAVPRILDRDENFMAAMGYSFKRVARNLPAMAVWAILIVSLTAIGIATAFIGLAVIFPVLGFATWHSYKAISE